MRGTASSRRRSSWSVSRAQSTPPRAGAYYQANGFFWAKIAAFVAVDLLSIIPTTQIIRWRRALTADAAFLPTAPDIGGVRRYLWAEVAFFGFIPVFAAAMARGYGVLAH